MRSENKEIRLTGEEAIAVFREIELILASLHRIGARYGDAMARYGDTAASRREYEAETTRFIDQWQVTKRLAEARALLSSKFDLELGDDDMDDLERACQSLPYWDGKPDQEKS